MPPKKDAKKGDKGEKKDEGKWQIVSKTATRVIKENNPKQH